MGRAGLQAALARPQARQRDQAGEDEVVRDEAQPLEELPEHVLPVTDGRLAGHPQPTVEDERDVGGAGGHRQADGASEGRDEDAGDPECLIAFVLLCAEAFDLTGLWGFEYANSCSRPRLDAYGGGAHVVDLGARKAIGWVLRETSKQRPELVRGWLATRAARASALTIREASKYLDG